MNVLLTLVLPLGPMLMPSLVLSPQQLEVHLIQVDGAVSLARAGHERLTPKPPLALQAGDEVIVADGGFALLLYPGGPVKLWPGDVHVVRSGAEQGPAAAGRGLWQRITRTLGAMTGARQPEAAAPRQGTVIMGRIGPRRRPPAVLQRDRGYVLSERPRFHYFPGSAAPNEVRISVHASADSNRCSPGDTLLWEAPGRGGSAAYPDSVPGLVTGTWYRVAIADATGAGSSACFAVASLETREQLAAQRLEIMEEVQDVAAAAVLWAALLLDAGFGADALTALSDVLERQPQDASALALRDHVRRSLLLR